MKCLITEVTHITSALRALGIINHTATTTIKRPGNAIMLWSWKAEGSEYLGNSAHNYHHRSEQNSLFTFLKFTIYAGIHKINRQSNKCIVLNYYDAKEEALSLGNNGKGPLKLIPLRKCIYPKLKAYKRVARVHRMYIRFKMHVSQVVTSGVKCFGNQLRFKI